MSGPAPSDLRRDLELIDAALLETVQRLLTGESLASGPVDDALCRLTADRIATVAETARRLVARPHDPFRVLEAA